jgi:2-haloacid dehalogenase
MGEWCRKTPHSMTLPKRSTVIFDFGGVLVDWNPRYLYREMFAGKEEEMEWFIANVCNWDWILKCDIGLPFEESTLPLIQKYPKYERHIRAYMDDFEKLFGPPVEESVRILAELRDRKTPLYGLTNWARETFPKARKMFPFFSWFAGIVVSGEVKLLKPDPRIFDTLLRTYSLRAEDCVFIDDRIENVETSQRLGFHGVHFQTPGQLRTELVALGLL